ncbi:dienelactone hydrolase, partial [Bacillus altitudinis]|nr:dienelactone hydrolase [Bacillus altitudinis]
NRCFQDIDGFIKECLQKENDS